MHNFSDEQVEAAAKALHETQNRWFYAHGDWGAAGFEIKQAFRVSARAALVAAQGAAPQAESDRALEIAHELAKVHTFTLADGEAIARAALSLAAPVQPSSTVDEGKIAEVVRGLKFNDAGCWDGGIDCTESVSDHADVIARAVVEALGGGSRGRSN